LPSKSSKDLAIIGAAIAGVAIALFAYLMWYVSPDEVTERVKIISNSDSGCVVETFDGFAITLESCVGEPGDIIVATYDAKVKERAAMMNPTR